MHDYAALAALAHVIRRGTFDAAAAALGITPSAVSQRIKALEERLGAVLVRRGTPATGTEAGLRLVQHFDQVRLLEQRLDDDMRPADGPASLRIAVNADSLATWFPAVLPALPVLYDLVVDDQDHAAEWLRRGQVSAAITSQPAPVPGCDSFDLGAMRYQALATPAFRARYFGAATDAGAAADAFAAAPCVTFNSKDGLQARWAEAVAGTRLHLTGHMVPSSEAFARIVELGLGWGMIPDMMSDAARASGALIPLVPDRPMYVALYWQVSRAMATALVPLTRRIRKRATEILRP
ncbi:LysR family transcriptional regulator ArgP [Paracoccus pacificus]|uniref:LysR family transcriptional regulator ArgP n=1 Tax=Paracoccus pacificus TaxID=1463598 RepID=A0ABW4RB49_9RHOB